jgi:hypothetical protein
VYPLRNGNDIILPFCRLSSTSDSVIPSTIKMWNSNIRNVDILSQFKSILRKIDETENHSVPKHFFCGPRKLDIILTQLRSSASFLNFDLFRVGIVSDHLIDVELPMKISNISYWIVLYTYRPELH